MSRSVTGGGTTGASISQSLITGYPFAYFGWYYITPASSGNAVTYTTTGSATEITYLWARDNNRLYGRDRLGSVDAEAAFHSFTSAIWIPALVICESQTSTRLVTDITDTTSTTDKGTFVTPTTPELVLLGDINSGLGLNEGKVAYFTVWDGTTPTAGDITDLIAGVDPATIAVGSQVAHWDFQTSSLTDSVNSYVLSAGSTTYDAANDPVLAGGATITGQPSVVRPSGTGYTITGTGFGTTFATATLVMNGTTGVSATITGVTDTTVTFSMPAAPASLFDATGWTFTFTADDASSDTSAVVPYDPPTTHDFITLTSIAGTDADFTYGYSGATVASGKQVVYETPTLEDSLAIVVSADCSFTLGSPLTQNNTSDYYVIDADGTIGVTDTNTFLFAASSGDSNGGFMSGFGNLGLG